MINDASLSHLRKDPVMKKLIENYSKPSSWYGTGDHFLDLVEIITNQQISYKAGKSIFAKLLAVIGTKTPSPEQILMKSVSELREAGLSRSKAMYIQGIAKAIMSQDLVFSEMNRMSDEEVAQKLIKVRGIGPWTAEMFLIFSLNRSDVFSIGDLGLRKAISSLYGVADSDTARIKSISEKWSPFRSVACLYLWQSLDNQ